MGLAVPAGRRHDQPSLLQWILLCNAAKWSIFLLYLNSRPISAITQVITFFMASEFAEAIYVVFASAMSYLILNLIELASVESIQESI